MTVPWPDCGVNPDPKGVVIHGDSIRGLYLGHRALRPQNRFWCVCVGGGATWEKGTRGTPPSPGSFWKIQQEVTSPDMEIPWKEGEKEVSKTQTFWKGGRGREGLGYPRSKQAPQSLILKQAL